MIDLETASLFPLLPISQAPAEQPSTEAPQAPAVKPFIIVISESEFLILSWTGASTLGLFITGEGDPIRGTLEWSSHPISVGQ
jgi:vacuolar protein sorting-associated protein 3